MRNNPKENTGGPANRGETADQDLASGSISRATLPDLEKIVSALTADHELAQYDSVVDALQFLPETIRSSKEFLGCLADLAASGRKGVADFRREHMVKLDRLSASEWTDLFNSRTYTPPVSAREVKTGASHDDVSLSIYGRSLAATAAWAKQIELLYGRENAYTVSDAFYRGFRKYLQQHSLQFAHHTPYRFLELTPALGPEYRFELLDYYLGGLPDAGLAVSDGNKNETYVDFFQRLLAQGEDWFPPRQQARTKGGITQEELFENFVDTIEKLHAQHAEVYLPDDKRGLVALIDQGLDRFLNKEDPISPLRGFTSQFPNPELNGVSMQGTYARSVTRLILGLYSKGSLPFEETQRLINRIKNIATAVLEPPKEHLQGKPVAQMVSSLFLLIDGDSDWTPPGYNIPLEDALAWRETANWAWMLLGQSQLELAAIVAFPQSNLLNPNHLSSS